MQPRFHLPLFQSATVNTSEPPPARRIAHAPLRLVFDFEGQGPREAGMVDTSPEGTDATVAAMFGVLREAVEWPSERIVHDPLHYARVVYRSLHATQVFQADPVGVEYIRVPTSRYATSFGTFAGDCDDVAMRAIMRIKGGGHTPILAVSGDTGTTRGPERFKHIFWGVRSKPGPLSLDTVILADSQEEREPGHIPPEPYLRLYEPTGQHA